LAARLTDMSLFGRWGRLRYPLNMMGIMNMTKRIIMRLCFLSALLLLSGCAGTPEKADVEAPVAETAARPVIPAMGSAPREYTVSVGDTLSILVYNHPDLTQKILVSPSGKITFPFVGDVQASGRTLSEIRDDISGKLGNGYIPNPQVAVNFDTVSGRKIYVLGEVKNPRLLRVKDETDVVDAITQAGGFTQDANRSAVLLIRRTREGKAFMDAFNVSDFLSKSDLTQNPPLMRDDIVFVPPSKIASVERFFMRMDHILAPIRLDIMEGIILTPRVEDALKGKSTPNVQVE